MTFVFVSYTIIAVQLVIFMSENSLPSNQDIFEIVTFIKDNAVTKREFDELKQEVSKIKTDLTSVKTDLTSVKTDLTSVKATMVTKDYLDEKLADLRGDLVVLTRNEDTKLKVLIKILKNKKIITNSDEKQLLTMEPFAELMI